MRPGIYPGIEHEDYLAAPGVSVSLLKRFAVAPAKAKYGVKGDEKPHLQRGTLTHCAVLEPHDLERRFTPTDLDRTGTKAWAEAEIAAGGRRLVKRAEWEIAARMRDAVLAHPVAAQLLAPGNALETETSFWWTDTPTGTLCRGRADGVRHDYKALFDVKTTQDASGRGFADAVARYKYSWQAAHYLDGYGAAGGFQPAAFIFIAVESEAPHLVATYELDPSDLAAARGQVRAQLDRFAECVRTDTWPGYPDDLQTLTLPAWAAYR